MSSSGSVGMMRADVANETDVLERGLDGYIPSDFVPRSRPQDTTLSSPVHTSNRPGSSAVRDRIRMFDAERAEGDSSVALYDFSRDGHTRRGIRLLQGISPRACVGIVVLAVLVVSTVIGFALMGDDNSQRPVSKAAQVVSADSETHRGEAREKTGAESSDHGLTGASAHKKEVGAQEGSQNGHERASQPIAVAVVCNVVHPGLVSLDAQARVDDAINAAGGLTDRGRWDGLNRAQKLLDGQQICVGEEGKGGTIIGGEPAGNAGSQPGAPAGGAGGGFAPGQGSPGQSGGGTNINTAGEAELTAIPGVGPKTASAIIAYREQNGPFRSIDQLAEVKGIGPAKLAAMRDAVTI
ncbi:ComEA family DNA-binding protein [Corynebacterium pseudokroppenstedtii]|uniref:ComEA family DNA-binding protein n=1 Tax=Corynebacterium pseudokroppenstedtii TaxID=2804917 RepID=UPI003079FD84